MPKSIYLDNSATTPVDEKVLKAMEPYLTKLYGNPSSFNDLGRISRKAVDNARHIVARFLGAKAQEIIFTGSGTEANNLAIFGIARPISKSYKLKAKSSHIITTQIEHPSVLRSIQYLEKQAGFSVTYLPVDKYGMIRLEDLREVLRPETVLISIIHTNNEIGAIQPIKKISKIVQEYRQSLKSIIHEKAPFFHVDACQAAGYLDTNVNNLGVDLLTINASKIYGPKGVGALYVKRGTPIEPVIYGGGQENGLRSGTENVPGIVGLGKAVELVQNQKSKYKMHELRNYFTGALKRVLPEAKFNGQIQNSAPHIISVIIPGVESEAILLGLDKYRIYASAGAACSTKELEISHVLKAIGLTKAEARSTLRFSLGRQNTKKEIDYVIKILPQVVSNFKKLYPQKLKDQYYVKIK